MNKHTPEIDDLWRLITHLKNREECLMGSQWEDMIITEYDTPSGIIRDVINIFLNSDIYEYDYTMQPFGDIYEEVKFCDNNKRKAMAYMLRNFADQLTYEEGEVTTTYTPRNARNYY